MFSQRVAVVAALLGAACAPVVMKTPVSGPSSSVARLVGDWQGQYSSVESGRHGLISFHLKAGADTAQGDVIMQPDVAADPSAPNAPPVASNATQPNDQALSIRFVFVSENEVSGTLNPYRDPTCGCSLTTTFRGTIKGNEIKGTFHSEGNGLWHIPTDGKWSVKRYSR